MQKYNFSLKQTKNLITIWLFGKFLFGCLVSFRLVIWQVFIWLFGKFSLGYLAKLRLLSFTQYYSFKDNKYAKIYEKSPHRAVQQNRRGDFPSSIIHHPSHISHHTSAILHLFEHPPSPSPLKGLHLSLVFSPLMGKKTAPPVALTLR